MKLENYSDPESETSCRFLGGIRFESITLSRDQMDSLQKLYRCHDEENVLMQAGMRANVLRRAKHDGSRLMAILAKYCDPGEDPAKVLVRMLIDLNFEESGLYEWAMSESSEEESSEEE